jgi:hypothetical protein
MTALGFHGGSHCGPDHAASLQAAGASATFGHMSQLPMLIARFGQNRGSVAGFSSP